MIEKLQNLSRSLLIRKKLNKVRYDIEKSPRTISCVIFSMNRAMQLHALLRSLLLNGGDQLEIIVLFKATTVDHMSSYKELELMFEGHCKFINQKDSFKNTLTLIVKNIVSSRMFFLVDDIVFIRSFNFKQLLDIDPYENIFSLRLGKQLDYSYVVQKKQGLPTFEEFNKYLSWSWEKGEFDWAYPLSVDGHLFNTSEVEILVKRLNYSAPNSFENSLQVVNKSFSRRRGLCCENSVIVNIPCNRVQDEVLNLSGDVDPDELLKMWNKGYQIDLDSLNGYMNKSVHEIISFNFTMRNS